MALELDGELMRVRFASARLSGGEQRSSPSSTDRRAFRADIQGLRAIAVVSVLLFHAGFPTLSGGYLGVDVFFVISGFLITGHLLEGFARHGRMRLLPFYAKRILRILPAAWTVASLTVITSVFVYPAIALPRIVGDAIATIVYVPNLAFAARATDYLADHSPSPFQQYWSLGVEEQFYLLWPVVLWGVLLLCARRPRLLIAGIGILLAASLALGMVLTQTDQPTAFFTLPTRAWELLAGALTAAVLRIQPGWGGRALTPWIGLLLIATSMIIFDSTTPMPGLAAVLPVLGTCVVLFGGRETAASTRLLALRPVQFIGRVSYSLYLVHWPILILGQAIAGEQHPLSVLSKVTLVVISVPVAWLVFFFVETPFRGNRRARPIHTIAVAAAVTIALVGSLVGLNAWSSTREGTLGPAVASAPSVPIKPAPIVDIAPQNLTPALEDATRSLPDMYADGCHAAIGVEDATACVYGDAAASVSVAIFGDSHAAQWLPALQRSAEGHRIRIVTYTKSSCPAADVTVLYTTVPDRSCEPWRENVLRALQASPPDLVIISDDSSYELANVAAGDRVSRWATGLQSTLSRIVDVGMKVTVIADTPRQRSTPASCVAANPRDITVCASPRNIALHADLAAAERMVTQNVGAIYADFNSYVCSEQVCPVVITNLLVYRDEHHLTVPFARYMAPAMENLLESAIN